MSWGDKAGRCFGDDRKLGAVLRDVDFSAIGLQALSALTGRYFDRHEYRRVLVSNENNARYLSACWSDHIDAVRSGSIEGVDVEQL